MDKNYLLNSLLKYYFEFSFITPSFNDVLKNISIETINLYEDNLNKLNNYFNIINDKFNYITYDKFKILSSKIIFDSFTLNLKQSNELLKRPSRNDKSAFSEAFFIDKLFEIINLNKMKIDMSENEIQYYIEHSKLTDMIISLEQNNEIFQFAIQIKRIIRYGKMEMNEEQIFKLLDTANRACIESNNNIKHNFHSQIFGIISNIPNLSDIYMKWLKMKQNEKIGFIMIIIININNNIVPNIL